MTILSSNPTTVAGLPATIDYGPAAERAMAEKRADYYEAGTLVVWDVDPIARTIACYRAAAPPQPTIFRSGDTADAEPAVPGWRVSVHDVLGPPPSP
jgi:hypothetical protein